jgi:type VI secretion system secreted protein VgrG
MANLSGQATQKAQAGSRELDQALEAAVERFGTPLIVAESPSSLVLASPASTALFAGEHLHLVTQGDAHYGAAHTLSSVAGRAQTWFTHAGGLEAVAANGPLSIQAHTDQLELLADKEVTVVSVNSEIQINAKTQIVLKAGQTSITLDGANITFACPGTFSVKGSGHSLAGGASSPALLPKLADKLIAVKPMEHSIRWQAISAVDMKEQSSVDIVVIEVGKKVAAVNASTGGDGRSQRVKNQDYQKEYTTLIGSGDWVIETTTDEEPQMLERTNWMDEAAIDDNAESEA